MSVKVYQWFDTAEELVLVMLGKTQGTRFEAEAIEIAQEFESIQDMFLEHIAFDEPWDAKSMFERSMAVQGRLIDMGKKVERPN